MEESNGPSTPPPFHRPFPNILHHNSPRRRPTPPQYHRFLCKASTIASVITKRANPFDLIGRETGASIGVEEPAPDCDMRFVAIVAPEDPRVAGEALVRVLEILVEVEGEGSGGRVENLVFCRVMIARALVGPFIGKKGTNVDRIRRESGARIRVLPLEAFLDGATSTDEVVQISGNPLAVKKAVIAVSAFLRDNLQSRREQINGRDFGAVSHATLPVPCGESYGDASISPAAGSSVDSVAAPCPRLHNGNHLQETKKDLHEVSYRLLCSSHNVGGVIGRGATIIKALEKETDTSIRFGDTVTQSDERVITIAGFESYGTRFSSTQSAVIRVFIRIIEASIERRVGSEKVRPVIARLLVPSDQIGCIMGKEGAIVADIRKATGANIRIISGSQVPKCASGNDEVVQVSGKLQNVQDGLFHITRKLRDYIFSCKMPDIAGPGCRSREPSDVSLSKGFEATSPGFYESLTPSFDVDHQTTLAHGLNHLSLHSNSHPSSSHVWKPETTMGGYSMPMPAYEGGLAPSRCSADLGRGSKAVIVTNTTMEILVPAHCIALVYGNNGANLGSIRQISGAKVTVNDPLPGASDGVVIISGTPDQTLAAQSLLQAYILSGQS